MYYNQIASGPAFGRLDVTLTGKFDHGTRVATTNMWKYVMWW